MPRGRKTRKPSKRKLSKRELAKQNLTKLDIDLSDEKKEPKKKDIKEDIKDIDEILLNLDEMYEFIKVKTSAIAVCYLIPTTELGKEDSKIEIKTNIVKSLQNAAEAKRMHINTSKIHIKTYPRGAKTYVKAWFNLYDATGRGAPKIEKRQKQPKEGLWIVEEEVVTQ